MTDRSTWIAEKRRLDKLRTPDGQAQDYLEHSLPAVVLREAQADPLWNTQPETVTKVTLYTSVLEQARARLARLRSWQKLFDTYVREQAGTPLLAWAGNTAHSLAHGCSNPETNAGLFSEKARELFLSFIRDQQQCVFRIGDVNREESPVFSPVMAETVRCLPESTPELWDLAIEKATPKPLTPEERAGLRQSYRGERIMQDRADKAIAVFNFCKYMCGNLDTCSRSDELLGLCAVGRAFHCSACTGKSLPEEMQPGFRLFKRLLALRKELIRIASAAAGWHWLFSKNPDMPRYEVRRVMHEAWQSGVYPRGKLNLPWEVWDNDIIDMASMDSYPQVMPDDLFILSADGGKLALWRATK